MLTLMAGMTALSVDIYLPSMPALAVAMNVSPGTIGLTVSVFILSFAFGQLIYGPLADRFGRRKPLLVGLAIYLVANLICAFATNIEVLLFGRLLQGLGACAGSVVAQAVVRDVAKGSEGTRLLASVASAMALAPIIAPVIGGMLETHFSWRASFYFLVVFGAALSALLFFALPETAPPARQRLGVGPVARAYLGVSRHPSFVFFTMLGGLASCALFAFISTSSALIVDGMGFTPDLYGMLFGANAVTYMIGSIVAKKLAARMDNRSLALAGTGAVAVGGGLMVIGGALLGDQIWVLLVPMALTTMGVAAVTPAAMSGAMEPFGNQAGTASALHGCFRFVAAAVVTAVLGLFTVDVVVLGIAIAACGAFGLLWPSLGSRRTEVVGEAVNAG
nr:multidrug effflux MFS transporter [Acanthopleuribacter pedis]